MKTLVAFVLPFVTNCLQIGSKDYSVQQGSQQVIKCRYASENADYVKYWCKGYYSSSCSVLCSTDHKCNSKIKIEDNRRERTITITMYSLDIEDSDWYWCGIDNSIWSDIMDYTHITVSGMNIHSNGGTGCVKCRGNDTAQDKAQFTDSGDTSDGNKVHQMYYILIPLLCLAVLVFIVVLFVRRFLINKSSAGKNLPQPTQEGSTPAIVSTPPSDNSETSIMYAEIVLNSKEKTKHSKTVAFNRTSHDAVGGTRESLYSEIMLK